MLDYAEFFLHNGQKTVGGKLELTITCAFSTSIRDLHSRLKVAVTEQEGDILDTISPQRGIIVDHLNRVGFKFYLRADMKYIFSFTVFNGFGGRIKLLWPCQ